MYLSFLIVPLLIAACTKTDDEKPSLRAQGILIKEIAERNRGWGDAIERLDSAAILSFYTTDAMLLPPNGSIHHGHEGVLSFFGVLPELGLRISDADFSSTRILATDTTASEIGTYVLTLKSSDQAINSDTGKYITLWKRPTQHAPWKIYATIWNTSISHSP